MQEEPIFYYWKRNLHIILHDGVIMRVTTFSPDGAVCIGIVLGYDEHREFISFRKRLESLPYAQESK